MASPIGHIAAGVAIYAGMRKRMLGVRASNRLAQGLLLGAAVFFSQLPDADSALGIWFGDFAAYHNNLSHSLFFALAVALVGGGILRTITGASYRSAFSFVLLCYGSHVVFDYLTVGRGVMLFWPLTSTRFQPPILFFYGLHWSEGFFSTSHFLTLANELSYILLGVLIWLMHKRGAATSESTDGRAGRPALPDAVNR